MQFISITRFTSLRTSKPMASNTSSLRRAICLALRASGALLAMLHQRGLRPLWTPPRTRALLVLIVGAKGFSPERVLLILVKVVLLLGASVLLIVTSAASYY